MHGVKQRAQHAVTPGFDCAQLGHNHTLVTGYTCRKVELACSEEVCVSKCWWPNKLPDACVRCPDI